MRSIKYIFIHCTATDPSTKLQSILDYWKSLGWKKPGYHFMYYPDGHEVKTLPISEVSNGVKGYNENSIHLSYIGGIDSKGRSKDTRTEEQKKAMESRVRDLLHMFPKAQVLGHRDVLTPGPGWKDCPSFSVFDWLKEIGINSKQMV